MGEGSMFYMEDICAKYFISPIQLLQSGIIVGPRHPKHDAISQTSIHPSNYLQHQVHVLISRDEHSISIKLWAAAAAAAAAALTEVATTTDHQRLCLAGWLPHTRHFIGTSKLLQFYWDLLLVYSVAKIPIINHCRQPLRQFRHSVNVNSELVNVNSELWLGATSRQGRAE